VHLSQKLGREGNARTRTNDRIYATPRTERRRANIIHLIDPIFNLSRAKCLATIEAAAQLAAEDFGSVAARAAVR